MPNPLVRARVTFPHTGASALYEPEAIAVFTAVPDLPANQKDPINTIIRNNKHGNKWTELKHAIVCVGSMTNDLCFIDLKTATVLATPSGASPSSDALCVAYPCGYLFREGSTDYVKTGVNDSALGLTTTSAAVTHGEMIKSANGTKFAWGVIQGAAQRRLLNLQNASNQVALQMYDGTSLMVGSTDTRGRWWANRNASNYLEIVKDNSILATRTAVVASTIPTIETYFGSYNNSGATTSPADGIRDYYAAYIGQSTADRSMIDGWWATFRTDMGRANPNRQIVFDGNSLTKRNKDRLFRRAMYNLSVISKSYNNVLVRNYGVPGQTTADLISDYSTQVAPAFSNTGYTLSQSHYVFCEVTNDLWGGATVATAKANIDSLVASAKATGFKVWVMVPICRYYLGNTGGRSETQWNLDLDALRQYVRANSFAADHIIDITDSRLSIDRSAFASDALFNTQVNSITNNLTYYVDGTHLTDTGYDIWGAAVATALATAL
jgi:lysophospholipase L1-like esterase